MLRLAPALFLLWTLEGCVRAGPAPSPSALEGRTGKTRGRQDGAHHAGAPAPGHRHCGGPHRFDDAEAWAKVFDDPARDAWQRPEAVIDEMGLTPSSVVADIGAGTGYFTVRLARRVPQGKVIASDIEPDMVAYLRARTAREGLTNVEVVLGTPEDPRLPPGIDRVLVVDVFHHIHDPAAFFGKVRGSLAAGGRVVVVDFRPDAPEDAPGPPRAMRMGIEEVTAAMVRAGFRRSARDETTLPYQYLLTFEPAGDSTP